MRDKRKLAKDSMPSVVVLIPAHDGELNAASAVLTSPSKRRNTPSSNARPLSPFKSPPKASSSSSSSSSSTSISRSRSSPPKQRPLVQTSSSSSSSLLAPSSALERSSSSSSYASEASSSSSSSSTRSRSAHHAPPIDAYNPFGADVYQSFRRTAGTGQAAYVCQWRTRDKKGLLDPIGHIYCRSRLITPDLLAKHVLATHVSTHHDDQPNTKHAKTACKWGGCFNRHYDADGLASHIVHDHFNSQLGLKYACIVKQCPIKVVLTSQKALERHHSQYHADIVDPTRYRPFWRPQPIKRDNQRMARLVSIMHSYDAHNSPVMLPLKAKVAVSASANPKHGPLSEDARRERETEWKHRIFDLRQVRPGDGQDGQPWIRFYGRIHKRIQYLTNADEADEAVLRGVTYDSFDLKRALQHGIDCIELDGEPTLREIEEGIERAQLYGTSASRSPKGKSREPAGLLPDPSQDSCEIVLPEPPPDGLDETISVASLSSIEREMRFDTALAKQRRFANKVLGAAASSPHTIAKSQDSDQAESEFDWAPSLWLEPYHPASRCRLTFADETELHSSSRSPHATSREDDSYSSSLEELTPSVSPPGSDADALDSKPLAIKVETETLAPEPRLYDQTSLETRIKREDSPDDIEFIGVRLARPQASAVKAEKRFQCEEEENQKRKKSRKT